MDLNSIGLFNLASHRLEYLSARHKLVAENIANADTPGVKARDLKPFDFQAAMTGGNVEQARTDAGHLTPLRQNAGFKEDRRTATYEMAPDGNGVVLEEQMVKSADIRQAYDLATNLFQKHAGMLRLAFNTR